MATWRCPHCATPQVEGPRCFVCKRSATSCGTCVNFRRSLVGGVGYCALDRQREPLSGAEQRSCWSAATPAVEGGLFNESAPGSVPGSAEPLPSTARTRRGLLELTPNGGLRRSGSPPVSGT